MVRRLAMDYLSFDDQLELGLVSIDDMPDNQLSLIEDAANNKAEEPVLVEEKAVKPEATTVSSATTSTKKPTLTKDSTAPLCYNCGNQTQRAGNCYVCSSCGSTTGCS